MKTHARINDLKEIIRALDEVKAVQPIKHEYNQIKWWTAKRKYAQEHKAELARHRKAMDYCKELGLVSPVDRKPIVKELAELEEKMTGLKGQIVKESEGLDMLKTVRYWVRKVIPDAMPTLYASEETQAKDKAEREQNTIELEAMVHDSVNTIISGVRPDASDEESEEQPASLKAKLEAKSSEVRKRESETAQPVRETKAPPAKKAEAERTVAVTVPRLIHRVMFQRCLRTFYSSVPLIMQ